MLINCYQMLYCFITAGATGVMGKPGATGDTGHVHAAQHAPKTPPSANQCDGPVGK